MLSRQKCTAFTLGVLAGSLLMYAFDPVSGRRRRVTAKDKLKRLINNIYKYGNRKSRHLMNKAEGLVAKTQHKIDELVH